MKRRGGLFLLVSLVVMIPAIAHAVVSDRATAAGLYQVTSSWSANVADYNRDGRQDVLISKHGGGIDLFRNSGANAFAKVREWAGGVDRHDCAWGDVNADSRLDFYCTVGADHGTGSGENELWLQNASGTWSEVAAAWGVQDRFGRGRWATFFDANRDGRLDLYVGNDLRADGLGPSRFFLNTGSAFVEAPEWGVTEDVGNECSQAADVDRDGDQDLLVCGKERIFLYRNTGSSFVDASAALKVVTTYVKDATIADVNRDGRLDLVGVATGVKVQIQNSSGTFNSPVLVANSKLGSNRDVAVADFDGDGDADIYGLRDFDKQDYIYRNKGSGTSYTRVAVPQPVVRGSGSTVEGLNDGTDARTEFIVLNGSRGATEKPGSVQYIAWT